LKKGSTHVFLPRLALRSEPDLVDGEKSGNTHQKLDEASDQQLDRRHSSGFGEK
jgi:hypothetical protein